MKKIISLFLSIMFLVNISIPALATENAEIDGADDIVSVDYERIDDSSWIINGYLYVAKEDDDGNSTLTSYKDSVIQDRVTMRLGEE